ncbi:hypothetical protein R3P38DRAFT_3211363 [Favolaschia claudopus]|uniref:FAD-dependent oxidoreductase 2 FAD-binding domain-containing protein n=1 Tax=Favolaschia claudopus TaxID=2862362 RepID=A0AAW0AHG8_9AGAR
MVLVTRIISTPALVSLLSPQRPPTPFSQLLPDYCNDTPFLKLQSTTLPPLNSHSPTPRPTAAGPRSIEVRPTLPFPSRALLTPSLSTLAHLFPALTHLRLRLHHIPQLNSPTPDAALTHCRLSDAKTLPSPLTSSPDVSMHHVDALKNALKSKSYLEKGEIEWISAEVLREDFVHQQSLVDAIDTTMLLASLASSLKETRLTAKVHCRPTRTSFRQIVHSLVPHHTCTLLSEFFSGEWKYDDIFHVAVMTPVLHYTMGGLEIDAESRVIDSNGKPIPGLFAAGEVAGGAHGANRLGGSSLLGCVVFGRVSGDSAAAYLFRHATRSCPPALSPFKFPSGRSALRRPSNPVNFKTPYLLVGKLAEEHEIARLRALQDCARMCPSSTRTTPQLKQLLASFTVHPTTPRVFDAAARFAKPTPTRTYLQSGKYKPHSSFDSPPDTLNYLLQLSIPCHAATTSVAAAALLDPLKNNDAVSAFLAPVTPALIDLRHESAVGEEGPAHVVNTSRFIDVRFSLISFLLCATASSPPVTFALNSATAPPFRTFPSPSTISPSPIALLRPIHPPPPSVLSASSDPRPTSTLGVLRRFSATRGHVDINQGRYTVDAGVTRLTVARLRQCRRLAALLLSTYTCPDLTRTDPPMLSITGLELTEVVTHIRKTNTHLAENAKLSGPLMSITQSLCTQIFTKPIH